MLILQTLFHWTHKKVQENSKKDIEGNGWQDAADYNIDEVIPYKLTGTLPPLWFGLLEYTRYAVLGLKSCLERAGVKNPLDMENIKLALQSYNYGNGYLVCTPGHKAGTPLYPASKSIPTPIGRSAFSFLRMQQNFPIWWHREWAGAAMGTSSMYHMCFSIMHLEESRQASVIRQSFR